jgi:hypothetical protein
MDSPPLPARLGVCLSDQSGCSNISGLVQSKHDRCSGPDGLCAPMLTSLFERPLVWPSFNAGSTGAGLTCLHYLITRAQLLVPDLSALHAAR